MNSRTLRSWLAPILLAITLGMGGVFGGWLPVSAQEITDSLDTIGQETGLSGEDPRIIVARIIRTGLTVLGVIVVVIIMYGGFVWMTAGGSPERVEKARKILINAVVGLVIILASWGITTFVISSLTGALNGSGSGGGGGGGGGGGFGPGGSTTSFTVTDYGPEGEVSIRNIQLRITFSHSVDEDTVPGNVVVTNASTSEKVEGTLSVSSNKVTFVPTAACPEPNADRFCFDENTTFSVTVNDDIESSSGKSLVCSSSAGCTSSFTSGSIVDTEDPTVEFTYPDDGDGVPSGSSTTLQVSASDDSQVSGADFALDGETFTTAPAPDGEGAEVVIETVWDTADLEDGERYKVTATVTDIAGNETTDGIRVVARPATCFNGVLDADLGEEDVDCGGDSDEATYCGACDGGSCTEDLECSSGSCEESVCVENPEIFDLSPGDGAVGTYVTVSGSNFGASEGTVMFTSADGTATIAADVLACGDGDGWSDDEIIVAVPEGAGTGPVTVITKTGSSDTTDDEDGQLVPAFVVNDTERPGLCSLSDTDGTATSATRLEGVNFGSSRGTSTVNFDSYEAGSYSSWSSTQASVTVPSLDEGDYEVTITVGGLESNSLEYSIVEEAGDDPTIDEISPSRGGIGQYVTLTGDNFGVTTGSVLFTHDSTGEVAYGSIDFPDACADDIWEDGEIIIIVPETFDDADETSLTPGDYTVTVRTNGGVSDGVAFTVTSDDPTPGVCALSPDRGESGDAVTIYGDNFGSSGSVSFYDDVAATATEWDSDDISVTVPSGAASGPLTVTVSGRESNGVNFEIGAGDSTGSTPGAAFAWSMSTGEIMDTPEVVQACTETTVSAVPNSRFTNDGEVCVNAVVYAAFTTLMDTASVEDAVKVEKCTAAVNDDGDDPCEELTLVSGEIETAGTSATSFTWRPAAYFDVSSTYRVTVASSARSTDAIELADDVIWEFTTDDTADACVIDRVVIDPSIETLTEINETAGFLANPVTGCVITDRDAYTWDWDLDTYSYAGFVADPESDCDGDPAACATVKALAEGRMEVQASPDGYPLTGAADLIINFTDPYVIDYQPDCDEACVNADVGATFNTAMNSSDVTDQALIGLYLCENELCSDLTLFESARPDCVYEDEEDESSDCIGVTFGDITLSASAFYRVIISGNVRSTSGVRLIRNNYGTDYSWTFRVREDSTLCTVERVDISPSDANVSAIGDQVAYSATAYGEADSCSTSGQQLSSARFNWGWDDPVDHEQNNASDYVVADWELVNGSLADADTSSIATGCTTLCLPAGSEPNQAVCGNGVVEQDDETGAGEDCDPGDAVDGDGDGCSSSCKFEGTDAATFDCSGSNQACSGLDDDASCVEVCESGSCSISDASCSTAADCPYAASVCEAQTAGCGDGVISSTEDCDDANQVDGDGCSSSCTAEGSSSVGATCGNNDIAYNSVTLAGEECDDGNAQGGDGCSRECLREGSSSEAVLGTALCGDKTITTPYETCDDGNSTDGDGCSSSCLREGSNYVYDDNGDGTAETRSECGDGEIEQDATTQAGEDCEFLVDGEGCGDDCRWVGSSTSFESPSFCGDGVVGTGEDALCEDPASGDGKIDAVQVAEIQPYASYEVSLETGLAMATIQVTEQDSGKTTSTELTLACTAEDDTDCEDPSTQGAGKANCCYARPSITTTSPLGSDNCLNAAVSATFTQPMDTSGFITSTTTGGVTTEDVLMYARLELAADATCPYDATTAMRSRQNFAARVWNVVRRLVFGTPAFADSSDCIIPISSYRQVEESDGTYKVYVEYDELLEPSSTYTLVIEGDENVDDATVAGVRSVFDVGMNDTYTQTFTTGTEICTLDDLAIADSDTDSPYFFSQTNETHDFTATALSYSSGSAVEIEPITGVYDWEVSSWTSADTTIFSAAAGAADSEASVEAEGENGDTTVSATATITDDDYFGTACASTDTSCTPYAVSGSADVEAYLCENPWPALASYPWSDDLSGAAYGAEATADAPYTNFSTGYCKDSGEEGTTGDLPDLTVTRPPFSEATNVFKEYLFKVDDTSDAIGVRIISNSEYLSPMAWYEAQNFVGSPSETTVDGFPAVEDGRTVYVLAPNVSGSTVYSNIFAISYNENASDETLAIYEMMLENLEFVINVDDDQVCYDSGAVVLDDDGDAVNCESDLDCVIRSDAGDTYCSDTTSQSCSTDADCPTDETCETVTSQECGSDKLKLTRDITRLADLKDIGLLIGEYGDENGACSDTTSQSCTADDDCPDDETCEPLVPTLPAGTYVAALASSAWSSWNEMLGGALGDEPPSDPLNDYYGCGSDPFSSYDEATCVDQTIGQYACPENSYVYHYRANGSEGFELSAELEYDGASWYGDVDDDASDAYDYLVEVAGSSFCDGDVYGTSTVCGDGVVGASEQCEIGDVGEPVACDDDDTDTVADDGLINRVCKSDCSGYENSATESCVAYDCGNGIVEGVEECDDGAQNGVYGYCGTDCTLESGSYCGDGEVSGGEACDCGNSALDVLAAESSDAGDAAAAALEDARPYGGSSGSCIGLNGEYGGNENTTCAWDCSGPASYCGDGEVSTLDGEQCDGDTNSWEGELCDGGTNAGEACEDGGDCPGGVCGSEPVCELTTEVLCADEDDDETCSSWGTCESTGEQTEEFVCGVTCSGGPYEPEHACYCDGASDTECGASMVCVQTEAGSYTCAGIWTPYPSTTSCDGYEGDGDCSGVGSGAQCVNYFHNVYACEVNDISCDGTSDTTTCQDYDSRLSCDGGETYEACPVSTVCVGGEHDGETCRTDGDCVDDSSCTGKNCAGGTCSDLEYQTYRTLSCDDETTLSTCEWDTTTGFAGVTCKSLDTCGDGVINDSETCDDGNTENSDSCTNDCQANVCGDGYLYEGSEQCDEGAANGEGCDASYGSSCSACSLSCRYTFGSGEFCGDGETNGDEYCDADDVPYAYYHAASGTILSTCSPGDADTTDDVDGDTVTFSCENVGVCNGGDDNGTYCASNTNCDAGECVFPSCASDCASACPTTYAATGLQITGNEPGDRASSSASLYAYDSSSTSDLPNAAVLTMPACDVITSITADISVDWDSPEAYVVFITDLSESMGEEADDGRTWLEVVGTGLEESIDSLFDAFEDNVHIALVAGLSESSGGGSYGDVEDVLVQEFVDQGDVNDLTSEIDAYTTGGGAYTFASLHAAKELLDDAAPGDDVMRIAVLMSEGDYRESGDYERNPEYMACLMKAAGYTIYTISESRYTSAVGSDGSECEEYMYDSDGDGVEDTYYETWEDYEAAPQVDETVSDSTRRIYPGTDNETDGPGGGTWVDNNIITEDYIDEDAMTDRARDSSTYAPEIEEPTRLARVGRAVREFFARFISTASAAISSPTRSTTVRSSGSTSTTSTSTPSSSFSPGAVSGGTGIYSSGGSTGSGSSSGISGLSTLGSLAGLSGSYTFGTGTGSSSSSGSSAASTVIGSGSGFGFGSGSGGSSSSSTSSETATITEADGTTITWTRTYTCESGSDSFDSSEDASFPGTMACWSSGNPGDGVDYAYSANTAEEMLEAYDNVMDSIISIQDYPVSATIISSDDDDTDSTVEMDSAPVAEGIGSELPWPSGFVCDPDSEQELPILFSFLGDGQVTISNIQVNYCAP